MTTKTSGSEPEAREAEPSELADIIRQSWFGFGPREDRAAFDALEELLAQHERALQAAEHATALGEKLVAAIEGIPRDKLPIRDQVALIAALEAPLVLHTGDSGAVLDSVAGLSKENT